MQEILWSGKGRSKACPREKVENGARHAPCTPGPATDIGHFMTVIQEN